MELGHLRQNDLEAALTIQHDAGEKKKLGDILVEYAFIDEHRLIEILATKLGYPFVDPDFAKIDRELLRQVPMKMFSQHSFVPIERQEHRVLVAFADPLDLEDREAADRIFGRLILPAIAPRQAIRETVALFRRGAQRVRSARPTTPRSSASSTACSMMPCCEGVSDIHIEPMKDRLRVRFRRDGVLVVHQELNLDLAPPITTRIKVMAEADIAERRRHQDGRILYESPTTGNTLDLRVSFYVTVHGEKIVLRLMNKQGELLAIDEIGMAPRMLRQFRDDALAVPSGIMMVTGPTGAGKTTTLYSCVNALNDLETSIITAEEPVEYVIEGISQCSINPKIGVTFTETLRHIVRQDPDVIVMGEVRDTFSAETAIQAALTGHKVLTTFHTEDTRRRPAAPAQHGDRSLPDRLDRHLHRCPAAAAPGLPPLRRPLHPDPRRVSAAGLHPRRPGRRRTAAGRGCAACRFTGYKGRVGIFELLMLNEQVKEALMARRTVHEIRRISIESAGLVTLLEDGIAKAAVARSPCRTSSGGCRGLDRPRPLLELRRLLGE